MAKSDLTKLVEQLADFEERLGVSLQGLSAYVDFGDEDDDESDVCVSVCGEIYSKTGKKLKEDVDVNVVVYDSNNRVVGTSNAYFDSEEFYGFEVFEITVYVPVKAISKIRVYPK